ncbi:hypothetical protein ACFLT9_12580, partial [Acidobacteriota bacterium]
LRFSQLVKITGPDGTVLLEEMPVDTQSDWGDFMTGINISNRIPIDTEWKPGKYKMEIEVFDGFASEESHSLVKRERLFHILEKPGYSPFTRRKNPVSKEIARDFELKYEWGRNLETLGERGFSIDAGGNLIKWKKIGGKLCSYVLREAYHLTAQETENIIRAIQDNKLMSLQESVYTSNNKEIETERISITLNGESHTVQLSETPKDEIDGLITMLDELTLNKDRFLDIDSLFQEFCRILKVWQEDILSDSDGKVQFKECGVKRSDGYRFSYEVLYLEDGKKKNKTDSFTVSSLDEIVEMINRLLREIY